MKPVPASRRLVINCITESLLLLMDQKDFHKITIVDITKKAGVSRMAFYRNFASKEDILLHHCDEILKPFGEKIKNSEYRDMKEFLENFISTIDTNRSFFNKLTKSQADTLCWEHYITYLQTNLKDYLPANISAATGEYAYHFLTGGLANTLKAYYYNEATIPAETLIDLLEEILNRIILPSPATS